MRLCKLSCCTDTDKTTKKHGRIPVNPRTSTYRQKRKLRLVRFAYFLHTSTAVSSARNLCSQYSGGTGGYVYNKYRRAVTVLREEYRSALNQLDTSIVSIDG